MNLDDRIKNGEQKTSFKISKAREEKISKSAVTFDPVDQIQ